MNRIGWVVLIGVALLVVLVLAASLLAPFGWGRGYDGYGWGMGPWMMGGFGFPFVGGIGMLLFWLLVIGGIVWFVQALARGGQSALASPGHESPLDILRARYAKGEITKEQLDEMKRDLGL